MRRAGDNEELSCLHARGVGLIYNDLSGRGADGYKYNVLHAASCHWVAKSNVNVPKLQREVERQLLKDLAHYGIATSDLQIDWSEACEEGHCTSYLGGDLEELSGLVVRRCDGAAVADGWIASWGGAPANPTPPLDRKGSRAHNIVTVGPALQSRLPIRVQYYSRNSDKSISGVCYTELVQYMNPGR